MWPAINARLSAAVLVQSILISLLVVPPHFAAAHKIIDDLSCNFDDDTLCKWTPLKGNAKFEPIFNYTNFDNNSAKDRVLVIRPGEDSKKDGFAAYFIESPLITSGDYEMIFNVNANFIGDIFVVVIKDQNIKYPTIIMKVSGKRHQIWNTYTVKLPKFASMNIRLEIKFDSVQTNFDLDYVAINNVDIVDKRKTTDKCDYQCNDSDQCLTADNICDTSNDCPSADDENQQCDKLPEGSYCSFKHSFCHWFNYDNGNSGGRWTHTENKTSDGYLGAVFQGIHQFGAAANIKSVIFDEIPLYHSIATSNYYKSCKVRFAHLFSYSSIELLLYFEPQVQNQGLKPIILWRFYNRKASNEWKDVSIPLPINRQIKYRLKFSATIALNSASTFSEKVLVAIKKFSLSRECFGIGVPESEARNAPFVDTFTLSKPFIIPKNKSIKNYRFTSCGAKGPQGPTYSQCETFYLNSTTRAAVFENENLNLNGSQMWTVPKSGYYTIFAQGADGGNGLYNHPGANGALVRAVFFLQEGDTIFVSIGQAGSNACSSTTKNFEQCRSVSKSSILNPSPNSKGSRIEIGGGGGGATYVFKFKPHLNEKWEPLLIAGGGGGGSGNMNSDFKYSINQIGQGFDFYNQGISGVGEGSGGGWNNSKFSNTKESNQTGKSLLFGAEGGSVCKIYTKWQTNGGFGGGGGGCTMGGGGGGYHGGNINKPSKAGSGGTSYVDFGQSFLQLYSDSTNGSQVTFSSPHSLANGTQNYYSDRQDGLVVIIPQIDHCCNEGKYACLITDETPNGTAIQHCICEANRFMLNACVYERHLYLTILWIVLCILVLIFIIIFFVSSVIQKRNAKHKQLLHRNESNDMRLLSNSSTDVQLSRLRNHNAITEYNPNYEFGGSTCTLQDLKEIPREKLNLVKALGQGAFGEVYQGYLQNMPGEVTDELPVAVKTLPEYSANKQAEMDFLMEALIMSKFKHKNVVRFIGICFEKMPRFIILELLPGGDLKTFLRENRGTIDVPSPLVMGDLLVMSLDVACGCQYLEDNHFIHRDIAARNCLLTSKVKMPSSNSSIASQIASGAFDISNYKSGFNNSGIVVKIADFGMARDIYRADYYRKGGKAMLPVKWMPPEAFLDGVFTSKTDIWSFGVLLWEVLSMGYMPYPGRGNQEVMQLVTAGGRLEPPNSATPSQIYAIMAQCWNATPEFRPNFATIIERIGYCLQDPDVLSVSLPIFHRAASVEKDMTLMRPPPDATDYLIPNNPGSQTNSNYSMTTEKTELLSPDTCSSFSCINDEKLLEIDDQVHNNASDDSNAIQLWNDNIFSNPPAIPFNLNANFVNTSIVKPSYSGLVLNPNNLNFQQPCIRYVNVNVNNEIYNSNANPTIQLNSNLDRADKNDKSISPSNFQGSETDVHC